METEYAELEGRLAIQVFKWDAQRTVEITDKVSGCYVSVAPNDLLPGMWGVDCEYDYVAQHEQEDYVVVDSCEAGIAVGIAWLALVAEGGFVPSRARVVERES